jgi:hypothetical protein
LPAFFIVLKKYISFKNIIIVEFIILILAVSSHDFFGLVIEKQVPLTPYLKYIYLEKTYIGDSELSALHICSLNDSNTYRVASSTESYFIKVYLFSQTGELICTTSWTPETACKGGDCPTDCPEPENCTLVAGDWYWSDN